MKSLNPKVKHINGKDNHVVDMLSRTRYDNEKDMIDEEENIGINY
jgi:hypothetical protein